MTGPGREEMGRRSRISPDDPTDGPDEMRMVSDLDRSVDDAVLRGDVSGVPAHLVPLAAFIAALRGRVADEPAPPVAEPLRAQLAAPNVVALRAARSARRALVVAAAVLAIVALVGIGAAQNRLPSELQDVVASTADALGVDVPRSSERGDDRSDAGLEQGRGDPAPGAPAVSPDPDREPGHDGLTPGGALPADPGGPGEQATSATPPAPQDDGSEKADKVKPAPVAAPPTEAPAPDEGVGGALGAEDDQGDDGQGNPGSGDDDQGRSGPQPSSSGEGSTRAASPPNGR